MVKTFTLYFITGENLSAVDQVLLVMAKRLRAEKLLKRMTARLGSTPVFGEHVVYELSNAYQALKEKRNDIQSKARS